MLPMKVRVQMLELSLVYDALIGLVFCINIFVACFVEHTKTKYLEK